jgi:TolB-like protein/DNA-binding winged helix-turn-helix (wHTH) protein/tetratricopeptide (TPR) repeat protein
MVGQTRHSYEFGPFRLIPEERQLLRAGEAVPLTPKCFDLLVVLVENSGHLIEKSELLKRIWPDSFVEEANLSVNMSALRRALGEGPDEHQYVETVPRRGYRFVAGVKENTADGSSSPAEGLVDEAHTDAPGPTVETELSLRLPARAPQRSPLFLRWLLVLVGLLALPALLLGLNVGGLRERLWGNPTTARIQSLAVLPLENLSGDASQDYFAEGMTESLITDLARIGALRVISRPSVMQYQGVRKSLPEIGRELNVDAVLVGSVVRSGERVRINVQLIHAATDRSLWAESYDRDLRDVLALQKEVTQDIVGEIRIKLTPQEQVQFGSVRPVNPEAYDAYFRGKFYLNRQTKEDNAAAINALEHAVTVDPTFAAAHAELAQAYVWKLFLFAPKEQQWAEKAFVATEKALALDQNLAVAHLARGRILWTPANHFPHEKAIQEYRRALALNPSLDEARNQLALVYCHVGALDEALQESQKAVTINPTNNLAQFRIGQTLNLQGKYEQALAVLRTIPPEANRELVGHQTVWALINLGRKAEAQAAVEQFLKEYPQDNGGLFTGLQAMLAAAAGDEHRALENIREATEKGKGFGHFHHTAYYIACAYALMKKPEQAIKWLEFTADEGLPCYPLFERDPNLDNLRQDSRFVSFLAQQKQQWESFRTVF